MEPRAAAHPGMAAWGRPWRARRARALAVDWERWIGVRGAAGLGGIVLALAGLFFVQYSIQRGWLSPAVRVGLASLAGVAAALLAELVLRGRGYRATADALSGAGAVLLYGAAWAARSLYGLVPGWLGILWMGAVTLACGALAVRRRSQGIAVLGLLGGFATPLLLSLGGHEPIGLFGYLLLLDLGLIAVGRRRGWPLLGLLGVLGTLLVQALWMLTHLDAANLEVAIVFSGLAALLFALAAPPAGAARRGWIATQACSVLVPVLFALHFAARADLERQIGSLAALLALLLGAACWVAKRQGAPAIATSASIAAAANVLVWVLSRGMDVAFAWQIAAAASGLALVTHAALEIEARGNGSRKLLLWLAASPAAVAFSVCVAVGASRAEGLAPWPWLLGALVLAALLARQARLASRPELQVWGALGVGATWIAWHAGQSPALVLEPPPELLPALGLALAAAFSLAALARRSEPGRLWAWRSALLASLLALAAAPLRLDWSGPSGPLELGGALALGIGAAAAAAAARSPIGLACAALACAWVQTAWLVAHPADVREPWALALALASAGTFAAWPLVAGAAFGSRPAAWRAGALAPLFWLPALTELLELRMGHDGGPALAALALLSGATAAAIHLRSRTEGDAGRAVALPWYMAVAAGCASFALPSALGYATWIVGPALFACAAAGLAKRYERPWLARLSAALGVGAALRLAIESALLLAGGADYPRSGLPLWHWVSFAWGLPALALLGAALVLRRAEKIPIAARIARLHGALGLLALFAWINLEVANLFQDGDRFAIELRRIPERELTASIAWVLYALALLVAGLKMRVDALRWASLAFLLATVLKVFLFDLGGLEGLYRVGSLIGLAISLLAVSMLYQRFVFRRAPPAAAGGEA
ncbi:MAG TPA: DUF2339 domain-containing protein [Planctomycetota bacterium]|nr:DUF2339 domain-containing protein [Planctomycetota bacterium]